MLRKRWWCMCNVAIPLQCFVRNGADLAHTEVPFGVAASAPFSAAFADVRIVAGAGEDVSCPGQGVP